MKITLLNPIADSMEFIGKCAGICYNSKDEPAANRRRAEHCFTRGHLATLRFAHATFHVSGISRVCSHQFVRSKHLDFLQRSQRYCEETKPDFYLPETKDVFQELAYKRVYSTALEAYHELIDSGMKKEDARFVLPEATNTELIVTGNFQAWRDFIKLREGPEAQREIREVAKTIKEILNNETRTNLF